MHPLLFKDAVDAIVGRIAGRLLTQEHCTTHKYVEYSAPDKLGRVVMLVPVSTLTSDGMQFEDRLKSNENKRFIEITCDDDDVVCFNAFQNGGTPVTSWPFDMLNIHEALAVIDMSHHWIFHGLTPYPQKHGNPHTLN